MIDFVEIQNNRNAAYQIRLFKNLKVNFPVLEMILWFRYGNVQSYISCQIKTDLAVQISHSN